MFGCISLIANPSEILNCDADTCAKPYLVQKGPYTYDKVNDFHQVDIVCT
jgi:hypothetical protein